MDVQNVYAQTDSLKYYSNLALHPQNIDEIESAYDYFNTSYETDLKRNYLGGAVNSLYFIASIEKRKGNYDGAESTAVKALELLERMAPSNYKVNTGLSFYNLLGIIQKEQKNKIKALEMYDKAFGIVSTAKDSAIIYNNKSNVFKDFS